ncbi:MAG: hypothetical protein ABID63_10470 [Pseudomonadota bacterium]
MAPAPKIRTLRKQAAGHQKIIAKYYTPTKDKTLTVDQARSGGFAPRNGKKISKFRYGSNQTIHGYSSGYHEVLPTNVYDVLEKLRESKMKTKTITIAKKSIQTTDKILDDILEIADGFRTDTAQTILSIKNRKVAAHSGSNLNTKGQSEAHDLLRETVGDMIDENNSHKNGRTQNSMAVVLGSLAVSSMAPGEDIRKSGLPFSSLKAAHALTDWETRRNDAKLYTNAVFNTLSQSEKIFTQYHINNYLKKSSDLNNKRTIGINRSTSPLRKINYKKNISGGKYLNAIEESKILNKSLNPPNNVKELGLYMTQPLRSDR